MIFLEAILDLLVTYLSYDFMVMWFFPLLAMAFLATVPAIIRLLTSWR